MAGLAGEKVLSFYLANLTCGLHWRLSPTFAGERGPEDLGWAGAGIFGGLLVGFWWAVDGLLVGFGWFSVGFWTAFG